MAKIKIGLACAYCAGSIVFEQGPFDLRGKLGGLLREGNVTAIKCPHCDSTFTVDVVTKRKSKGRRLKAIEQKRAEKHAADVAAAITRNTEIAAALLAEPGCTCAAEQAIDAARWHRYGYTNEAAREKQLAEYGHLFGSTGASHGIPTPPRHDHRCPRARKES